MVFFWCFWAIKDSLGTTFYDISCFWAKKTFLNSFLTIFLFLSYWKPFVNISVAQKTVWRLLIKFWCFWVITNSLETLFYDIWCFWAEKRVSTFFYYFCVSELLETVYKLLLTFLLLRRQFERFWSNFGVSEPSHTVWKRLFMTFDVSERQKQFALFFGFWATETRL